MTNLPPTLTPIPPPPTPSPLWQSLWQKYRQLLSTSHRVQLISALIIITLFLMALSLIPFSRSKSSVSFNEPPLSFPTPSPKQQTIFANHPKVVEIEQMLPNLEASISSQIIDNHPLLPPALDMEVTLEE